jgi:hypothetical protein
LARFCLGSGDAFALCRFSAFMTPDARRHLRAVALGDPVTVHLILLG